MLLLLTNKLTAQYNVRTINTENGLAENTARSIYKHENGLVYIGTGVGLSVFDGENVINIPTSIKQEVKSIFQHGNDSLILIRDNGISIINIYNYGYRENNFNSFIQNKIINATKAGDEIYCATNEGLVKIDIKDFGYTKIKNDGIPKTLIYQNSSCITYSSITKNVYVAHRMGMFAYSTTENTVVTHKLNIPKDTGACGSIGCKNGVLYYKNSSRKIVLYSEKENNFSSYTTSSVHSVFNNNIIYYTYTKYLYLYDTKSEKKDSIFLGESRPVYNICAQSRDEIFIGTPSGMVIVKKQNNSSITDTINIQPGHTKYIELQNKISFQNKLYFNLRTGIVEYDSLTKGTVFYPLNEKNIKTIYSIISYTYGNVLVLGANGYCAFDLKNKKYYSLRIFSEKTEKIISENRVITGHYDSANATLLMCLYRNPVYIKYFKTNTEKIWNGYDYKWFRTVRSLYYLGNQEYYLGANGNDGLIKFSFKTGKGTYYGPSLFSKSGNNSAIINQILPYGKYIYLATADGLLRFNPQNSEFTAITLDGNPHNDQVYSISVINNELYASTRNALCKLLEDNNMFRLHTYENFSGAGLPFFANGTINLFVNNKLIQLNSPEISKQPNVSISHIGHINGWHQVLKCQFIELPYGIGSLQVLFSNPEMIKNSYSPRIMYRFSGEPEWQFLKGYSFQTGNLSYGKHEIEYFSIYWGKKSEIKKFNLIIQRPWWATVYFYAFCAVFILSIFWLIMKTQLKKKIEKKIQELSLVINTAENERNRISRDFHDGVGTKLSSIKLIAEHSRKNPNSSMVQQLPNLVDEILIDVRNIINQLSPQTLKEFGLPAALDAHIRVLKNQIKHIDFSLEVADGLQRMPDETESNLFRIVQELINNAIKHAECSIVKTEIRTENNKLIAMVTDNGKGMESQGVNSGHGLNNIRSRTEVLRGEMTMGRPAGGGTEIKISLPLESCLPPS